MTPATDTAVARHAQCLQDIARDSAWFMEALHAAREVLAPLPWCIGAGAVRNLVWDHLHGRAQQPSAHSDIDAVFFDDTDLSSARDVELQARLATLAPSLPWEVTNQAGVHLWFEACFGHAVAPLSSLEEAVASWPEYATAVGLRLEADEQLTVIAPLGLMDLFEMRVRRNPRRVSVATYRQRLAQKNYAARWPGVRIEPA